MRVQPFAALGMLVISLSGCGSPTQPSSTELATQVNTPAPAPAPAPSPPPAPSPAPAPSPPPAPEPAPAPTRYTAIVQAAHWYQAPLFGSTVSVERYPDRIVFGTLKLPISFEDGAMLVAKTPEMTLSITGSTWSFNGVAGQASGTIKRD